MPAQTLPDLLRGKRLQAGLTQQEACRYVGWKDINRLSDIEQGKAKIPIEDLGPYLRALGAEPEEFGLALLLSGVEPTAEEGTAWLKRLQPTMDSEKDACYLIDFTWRVYGGNKAALDLFQLEPRDIAGRPNLMKLMIDPESALHRRLEKSSEYERMLEGQIANFKHQHLCSAADLWFKRLLGDLMQDQVFRRIWFDLDALTLLQIKRRMLVAAYDRITLPLVDEHGDQRKNDKGNPLVDTRTLVSRSVPEDQRFQLRSLIPFASGKDWADEVHAYRATAMAST